MKRNLTQNSIETANEGDTLQSQLMPQFWLKVTYIYWVIVTMVSVGLSFFVKSTPAFLITVVFVSGPFIAPSIVFTTQLIKLVPEEHRNVWQGMIHGLKLFFLWGFLLGAIEIDQWLKHFDFTWNPMWELLRVLGPLYTLALILFWGWVIKRTMNLSPSLWQKLELGTNILMGVIVTIIPASLVLGPYAFKYYTAAIPSVKYLSAALGILAMISWTGAMIDLLKIKSGRRVVSVDALDVLMIVAAFGGPMFLVISNGMSRVAGLDFYIAPLISMAILMPGVLGSAFLTYFRIEPGQRNLLIVLMLLLLTSSVHAWAEILRALGYFRHLTPLLILTECINFGFFMLIAFFEVKVPAKGLERFDTKSQLRKGNFMPLLLFLGLIFLVFEAWRKSSVESWAPIFSISVLSLIIVLALIRHAFVAVETRGLYNEVSSLNKQLFEESQVDPLTNLKNRRAFNTGIEYLFARSSRTSEPLVVVMIDIDYFKNYNDSFGHVAGDELLKTLADIFQNNSRGQDIISRFGGEEFCFLLPNTNLDGAMTLVEELRSKVSKILGEITFSAGIAQWDFSESAESLISRSDSALYRAKGLGRDRTELFAI